MHHPIRRSATRTLVSLTAIALVAVGLQPGARASGADTFAGAGAASNASAMRTSVSSGSAAAAADVAIAPATERGPTLSSTTAFNPSKVLLGLSLLKGGFSSPVLVTNAGDGSNRLFVVEQTGRIKIIKNGTTLATPFLDLHTGITSGGERGLLGLAFHPRYPTVPYIYVNFTDLNGNTAINRYSVSSNPDVANRSSGLRLLTIAQPYSNHNGGNLAFGPDGYLYVGMGDGGSAGDPQNRAQNVNSYLGKMLRIDVDHGSGTHHYRAPASNPYVGRTGLDLIWSIGLRNPWRWSFDRVTHQLWIGDVGQDRWEEVDRTVVHGTTPAGKGVNFGWSTLEGRACFKPSSGCSTSGRHPPQTVYAHVVSGNDNCAVTGGFVYRGKAYPVLYGGYLYGDYCSGRMWMIPPMASAPVAATVVRTNDASPHLLISSFGEDEAGELYVCDLRTGSIYKVTATAKP